MNGSVEFVVIPRYDPGVGVEKIAASFSPELLAEMRRNAAEEGAPSLSAWLADAAAAKLRRHRMARAVADYEAEFGAITEEELQNVLAQWPV
jgi:hypothetical protein